MEHKFWLKKWQQNEIGFHMAHTNPMLVCHFQALKLKAPQRIFLPLCGKTLDIAWILEQGFQVVGAELSVKAVEEVFSQLKITPLLTQVGELVEYSAKRIKIYQGDFFKLTRTLLGHVDAVYDRAALVALPKEMRADYCRHLSTITDNAKQLLVSFDYDQSKMDGPPFSVMKTEICEHYGSDFNIEVLQDQPIEGGLKGICEANEKVYLLISG